MDALEWTLAGLLATFILGMITLTVLGSNLEDQETWTKTPKDCYIHEYRDNRFGEDYVTITELCPVK